MITVKSEWTFQLLMQWCFDSFDLNLCRLLIVISLDAILHGLDLFVKHALNFVLWALAGCTIETGFILLCTSDRAPWSVSHTLQTSGFTSLTQILCASPHFEVQRKLLLGY